MLLCGVVAIVTTPHLRFTALYLMDAYVSELPFNEKLLNKIYEKEIINVKQEIFVFDEPKQKENKSELNPYSVEMFKAAGVKFPDVHFLIHFKETSFCRPIGKTSTATLCTDDLIDIIGFNPNNGSGMKHPHYRKTTSIGSIGEVIKRRGIVLPKGYERYYKDPHAVYLTPYDHCVDEKLWQEYWFNRKKTVPQTARAYIAFTKKIGYNPYDHYYNHPRSGLYTLYDRYLTGRFQEEYDKYLIKRMNYSMLE